VSGFHFAVTTQKPSGTGIDSGVPPAEMSTAMATGLKAAKKRTDHRDFIGKGYEFAVNSFDRNLVSSRYGWRDRRFGGSLAAVGTGSGAG